MNDIKEKVIDNTDLNIFIISDDYNEKDFQIITGQKDLTENWKIYNGKKSEYNDIFEKYHKILNEYKDNKSKKVMNDVFILQIQNSKDKLIIDLLKYLDKSIDRAETYLIPFVIFLVDEETKEDIIIKELQDNGETKNGDEDEDEDEDNLDFLKFEQKKFFTFPFKMNELLKIKFKNRLLKICSYYHEIGDLFSFNDIPYNLSEIRKFPGYINILLAGRSGAGKSTFINEFLGDYFAKEGGSSLSTSHNFTKYHIPNMPIILIDSPGFENEETKNDIIKRLENMKSSLQEKDKIHLILYFIDGSSENKFLSIEKDVLQFLIKNPVPILFIASHCENNPNSDDKEEKKNYKQNFKKIKNALIKILGENNFNILISKNSKYIKNDIKLDKNNTNTEEKSCSKTKNEKEKENGLNTENEKKKIKDKKGKKGFENDEDIKNIILVNFKDKKVSNFNVPPFGIENIFNNIYYFLSNSSSQLKNILEMAELINEDEEIDKKIKEKQLEAMLKKNIFFQHVTSLDQMEKEKEEQARSVIRYQTFYAGASGLVPILDIASHYYIKRSLNNQIADIYGFNIEKEQNSDKKYSDDMEYDKKKYDLKIKKIQAENEITKNTQSSLSNTGKTAVGIAAGETGLYFLETAISGAKSLLGFGIRFASSMALLGSQIVIGSGYGGYKMYSNGEEILKIYKSKYYERKYESLISYIKSFINAINFFKTISDGFKELNDEKGEIKRKENKFDIKIIYEKYKIEVDLEEPEIEIPCEENNFGFEILDENIKMK